jgi:hypothetical protein
LESTSKEIKDIIRKIIPLLEYGENTDWLNYFDYTLKKLKHSDNPKEVIEDLSMIFKGGMGSFSDMVLHRNRVPLMDENDQLALLRNQLYKACKVALRG